MTLHCERLHLLLDRDWSIADLLVREIRIWSEVLGERDLASIILFRPYLSLEPFELTRVMHCVASHFKLQSNDEGHHIAVTSCSEIDTDNLALLKGLRFRHYQLIVEKNDQHSFEQLCESVKLLRDYDFQCVGIQLSHTDCLNDIREFIKRLEEECQPDYICTGSENDLFDLSANEKRLAMLQKEKSAKTGDILEIGLESISKIGTKKLIGFNDPERYKEALDRNHLPIHTQ